MTVLRVTQVPIEVLVEPDPKLRVTQVAVEVLASVTAKLRVTQVVVEVLVKSPVPVQGSSWFVLP